MAQSKLNHDLSLNGEPEEDFLEVDRPIPGQNWVCLSFVSPDKVLQVKEKYRFLHYLNHKVDQYIQAVTDVAKQKNTKEEMETNLREILGREKTDYDGFIENYKDYLFTQDKEISDKFDKQNNFQTSVRGVKIRGIYDSRREADVRAKVLQRIDQTFNVFIGQVGYWLAWDPNPDGVEKQEYLNDELNKLVKGYNVNQAEKDMFFEEQKREKKNAAMKEAIENKKKAKELRLKEEAEEALKQQNEVENTTETPTTTEVTTEVTTETPTTTEVTTEATTETPSENLVMDISPTTENGEEEDKVKLCVGGENDAEVSMSETVDALQKPDPWMSRKMADNESTSNDQ